MKLASGEIAHLCRGLGSLLHAGVSVTEGVYLLAEEAEEKEKALLKQLGSSMDEGKRISEAIEASGAFPEYVSGMLLVGEETGRMEETLLTLAVFYEERERVARQVKNALTYPGMIFGLMLAVIGVLLIKVLPVFEEVYLSLGGQLEGLGAGLLAVGLWMKRSLPYLLALAVMIAAGVLVCLFCKPVRAKAGGWLTGRFGDRSIFRKYNNAHFARALSMGLSSGLPDAEALDLARRLLGDIPGARERCDRCLAAMEQSGDMTEAMAETEFLSRAQCRLLKVGLQGGNADRMMEDIADKMMEDAGNSLESIVMKVEPTMVMVGSMLVGAILLTVMLPLMNIMSLIG